MRKLVALLPLVAANPDASDFSHAVDFMIQLKQVSRSNEVLNAGTVQENHIARLNSVWSPMMGDALFDVITKQVGPTGDAANVTFFTNSAQGKIMKNFNDINAYGCHCYFGEHWNVGRSTPTNDIDLRCRGHANCYKCIGMDQEDEFPGTECDPATEIYTAPTLKQVQQDGVHKACADANPTTRTCAKRVCSCDVHFAYSLIAEFFKGAVYDRSQLHSEGVFDVDEVCGALTHVPESFKSLNPASVFAEEISNPQKNFGQKSEHSGSHNGKACCGNFPMRSPYSTYGRGCCNGKTFDQNSWFCCGGSLSIGSC